MKRKVIALSVVVVFVLIVSSLSIFGFGLAQSDVGAAGHVSPHASAVSSVPATQQGSSAHLSPLLASMKSSQYSNSPYVLQALKDGVPIKDLYIPAFNNRPLIKDGVVMPSYVQSPAPMGIGAYGIENQSGTLTPFTYTTTGFNASINLTALQPFLLSNYAPSSVSIQLNAVMNNVTLFGKPAYAFWTQNVLFYSARQHYIEFVDNIWNFSSPAIMMSSNAIYSHTAVRVPYPSAYIGVGPVIPNVSTPMNVNLILNSAVIGGRDTVFFNYTVNYTNTSSGKSVLISGIFDEVQFNSTNGLMGYAAPLSKYLVTGSSVTPTGFIPWDAEIMIGGPGGGSSTDIYAINGTMGLSYLNSTGRYTTVPSAFDIGSETGETSTGIAEAWTPQGTVYLTAGPSLVKGMWGISTPSAVTLYRGTVSPANAFMFVSEGTSLNMNNNGWVPLSASGTYNFMLNAGSYFEQTMMSDYMWNASALATVASITLSRDTAMGIYTPLYAWNDAELANISVSGNGSATSPFIVLNSTDAFINPLFANMNDYGFQVFSGVLIAYTSAHVNLMNMPVLLTEYEMEQPQAYASFYALPLFDSMGYVLYSTSNVSVYGSSLITGDLVSYTVAGFLDADMMVWNSTHDLIASSVFSSENSISLLVYNPANVAGGNVIWGNWFMNTTGYYGRGLYLASSGNLIFNNYFGEPQGSNAYTPRTDPYTGAGVLYHDAWNISREPSTYIYKFNGFNLTGSIVGTSYVGGNYWDDYRVGMVLPFNESGNIEYQGDYIPLVITDGYYPIIITADNLPTGTPWWVNMSGYTKMSTSSVIIFYGQNGSYTFETWANGYYGYLGLNRTSMSLNISGSGFSTGVQFLKEYTLTITELNLPPDFFWAAVAVPTAAGELSLAGSYTSTITLSVTPGTYVLQYGAVGQYYPMFPEDSEYGVSTTQLLITGNMYISVLITPITNTFTIYTYGLAPGATWYVSVWMILNNNQPYLIGNFTTNTSQLVLPLVAAPYEMTFYAPGYLSSPSSIQTLIYPNSNDQFTVDFMQEYAVTVTQMGLPSGTSWTIYVAGQVMTTMTSSSQSMTLELPAGPYEYQTASSNPDYMGSTGIFIVSGAPTAVDVLFTVSPYARFTITFTESGLSSGTNWQVTFNGQTLSSDTSSISFTATPGNYYYQAYSNGSVSPDSSGYLNVQSSMNVGINFVPQTYSITFIAQGLPSGSSWSLTFNGRSVSTTDPVVVLSVPAGSYSYSVSASGYTLANNTSALNVGHNTIVLLQFHPSVVKKAVTSPSTSSSLLLDIGLLIIGLVVGAVAVGIYMRVQMNRKLKK